MKRTTTIFASSVVLSAALVASSFVISNAVSTPTIKACAVKTTGALRIITGNAKCKKTERLVSWGTAGAKGSNGAQGPAGSNGADGANGINGQDGAPGPQGDPGPAGSPAIPNVTHVYGYSNSWASITVPQSGWSTVDLAQSEPLPAGNYLVLANMQLYGVSGIAYCAATTSMDHVSDGGTYQFLSENTGNQSFSFSNYISVSDGQRIHLYCGDWTDGAMADGVQLFIMPAAS